MPPGGDDAGTNASDDAAVPSNDAPAPPAHDATPADDGPAPVDDAGGSDLDTGGNPPPGDDSGADAPVGDDGPPPPPDAPPEAAPPVDAGSDVTMTPDAPPDSPPPPCTCGAQSVCVSGTCTAARRVFVTHGTFSGNLGGATGADAKCAAAATAASLTGTWMAWVSDSTTSPSKRFTRSTVGYRLLDGTLVAADYTALTSGSNLSAAIDLDETGVSHASDSTSNSDTWTGTGHNGAIDLASCSDFKSSSSSGVGEAGYCTNAGGGHWSQGTKTEACNNKHHLYCFEQ